VTYEGSADAPVNAGTYLVSATVDDANYSGTASDDLVIAKADALVFLSHLNQSYTGEALYPTATTDPVGLDVEWINAPQTTVGVYEITAFVNDQNLAGSVANIFTIEKATPVITFNVPDMVVRTNETMLDASSSSGLPVSYELIDGPAVLDDDTRPIVVTYTNYGTVNIRVYQEESINWTEADLIRSYPVYGLPVVGDVTVYRSTNNLSMKVSERMLTINCTNEDARAEERIVTSVDSISDWGGTIVTTNEWVHYTTNFEKGSGDTFNFTVCNEFGGKATGEATIEVLTPVAESRHMKASNVIIVPGEIRIRVFGIPGRLYVLERTDDLAGDSWSPIGEEFEIPPEGFKIIVDADPLPSAYYRLVVWDE
jgi:hypothetical protein